MKGELLRSVRARDAAEDQEVSHGVAAQTVARMDADVYMVENCGMEGERICHGADEIPEDAGYYSLIILKGK